MMLRFILAMAVVILMAICIVCFIDHRNNKKKK